MFIHISCDGQLLVEETNDFRRFKVVSQMPLSELESLEAALGELAELESPERVWVMADALRKRIGREKDQAWLAQFNQMVESSKRYGFVRESPTMLAAHIEWPVTA